MVGGEGTGKVLRGDVVVGLGEDAEGIEGGVGVKAVFLCADDKGRGDDAGLDKGMGKAYGMTTSGAGGRDGEGETREMEDFSKGHGDGGVERLENTVRTEASGAVVDGHLVVGDGLRFAGGIARDDESHVGGRGGDAEGGKGLTGGMEGHGGEGCEAGALGTGERGEEVARLRNREGVARLRNSRERWLFGGGGGKGWGVKGGGFKGGGEGGTVAVGGAGGVEGDSGDAVAKGVEDF